jgi:hypothetical protein
MKAPETLERLQAAYALACTPFVRYVVETSGAERRDEADEKAAALYQEWCSLGREHQRAIASLLAGEGIFVSGTGNWPLEFLQFNYLSAAYLLRRVIERMGRTLDEMERLARGLDDWPEARDLLRQTVESERELLARAKELDAARPERPPRQAQAKGTSAARW